jgi:monofunctional biosynthetic peptidoglycan transglycosylase
MIIEFSQRRSGNTGARRKSSKSRKAPKKRSGLRRRLSAILKGFFIFLFVLAALAIWLLIGIGRLPAVERYKKENPQMTAMMAYRIEEAKREGKPELKIRKVWVPLEKMSGILKQAILASEDDRFFTHGGFDTEAMKEALEQNLKRRKLTRGASTITQQLAKNLFCMPERTIVRKLREAVSALILEWRLPKERILELYLNSIEMGNGIFGVEAASRFYFKKSAQEIEPYEAALMAAAIPSPLERNPRCPAASQRKKAKALLLRLKNKGVLAEGDWKGAVATIDALTCGK